MSSIDDSIQKLHVKVVSVDIVKYSLRLPPLQSRIVNLFTKHLKRAQTEKRIKDQDIKFLTCGDGALVVFMNTTNTPDIHIQFAEQLVDLVKGYRSEDDHDCTHDNNGCCECDKYDIRVGISQGLAVPFMDINDQPNYAGTPLNEASRIMGLAPINQIALSVCVFDEIGGYLIKTPQKRMKECSGIIKHGQELKYYIWEDKSTIKTDEVMINDLNKLFKDYSHLEAALSEPPKLVEKKATFDTLQTEIEQLREDIKKQGRNNDAHALLHHFSLQTTPPRLEYCAVDFATVEVLRKKARAETDPLDKLPKVISASAVICCQEQHCIILHHRSHSSSTYPNCLHTLGGSFKPRAIGQGDFSLYDPNLMVTAMREILEESGLAIQWSKNIPLWWLRETQTGFEQLLLAGASVTGDNMVSMESSWEGRLMPISFDDLEDAVLLQNKFSKGLKWTPTGLLSILLWLASGAHGAGANPGFNGKNPINLYKTLQERIVDVGIGILLGDS